MELINYCLTKFEVLRTLRRDERGVTALEYGLIAVVIIVGVTALGSSLNTMFNGLSGTIGGIATNP